MATISTRTTGTKITATIWNDDLVAPINDYETRISAIEAGVLTRYSQTALQTVSNTTAETTLSTVALAAAEFQDDSANYNNKYQYRFVGHFTDSAGGGAAATWRIKLGSSTGISVVIGTLSNTNSGYLIIDGEIWATAQSAQTWSAVSFVVNNVSSMPQTVTTTAQYYTTSAEDASGALNFVATVQLTTGAASPSRIMYQDSFVVKGPIELKTS